MQRIALSVLCVLLSSVGLAYGQNPTTGFPPFGSFDGGNFDAVNLQNLNAHFAVPVVASSGRGPTLQLAITYDSLMWRISSSNAWVPVPDQNGNPTWGWGTTSPTGSLTSNSYHLICGITQAPSTQTKDFTYIDANGTSHPFSTVLYYPVQPTCGFNNVTTGYATDASGYFINASTGVVYSPSGTQIAGSAKDVNGNQISKVVVSSSETDWMDSAGRTALKIITGTLSTQYQYLDTAGNYQTITLKYQNFNIKTNFACSGYVEYTGTGNLPIEIDLANGQKYSFSYEPTPQNTGYVTGRVQQVTLPTGGTHQYQYAGTNDGIVCSGSSGTATLTRVVSDGTTSATWQYAQSVTSGSSASTTVVTAPVLPYDTTGNQTQVTFNTVGQETGRKSYKGTTSGTLLRTINTAWASNGTPATKTLVLEDGSTQSEVETAYDSNGNLQTLKEHDWGSGSPGSVLRTTSYTYLTGSAYAAANIINAITDKTVADSSGTIKYRVHIDYDGAGLVNSKCVTGAAQHDDTNYGCSYTTRGLQTAVTTYTDAATPGGGITKNFSYDSLGNLISAQLNCCQQKQWNYSATTQYTYPDSVVSGGGSTQLTTSATYNFPTGQVASSTDENGQQTTYTYADAGHLNRLTNIKRPDNANITYSYNDSQRTVAITTPISSTSSVQKIAAFDPLGRPFTTTLEDGSNNTYSVAQVQYDVFGRTYKSSNPYTGTPQFWTTSQFDAIGRPSVTILPDGNQTNYSYATTSITVTDATGKQRASKSDGLGRMIEVDEPGSNPATAGTGSATVGGAEQSIAAVAATAGTGSVTIGGSERLISSNPCYPHGTCIIHIYDTGEVHIKVNGFEKYVGYGQSDTQSSIASNLANAFNGDSNSPVTASASNSIVYFTSKATGSATNYSLTTTAFTTNTTYFTGTSFTATPSGATLTGGAEAKSAIYDSGTVWISVNSTQYSASYGSSSTPGSLAIALANAINASSTLVTASSSGATVTLTANQTGASTNYSLSSGSSTSQPGSFSQPSFTVTPSGSALTGGADPTPLSLSTPAITFSTYNVLDQLTQVTEGAQVRKFNYDGMGRLQSATTPEAGTVCFGTLSGSTCQTNGYDSFDNLLYRTDARGVVAAYQYDGLNRPIGVGYTIPNGSGVAPMPNVCTPSGGTSANVCWTYGTNAAQFNNGRLIAITDTVGSEGYSYNNLGEVTQLQKVISGTTYTTSYAYNLAGEMTQIKYPSGRVVQQSFDAIGRLCEIAPSTTGCSTAANPYATAYGYNTASQMTRLNYGNGVVASLGFSADRLQMTSLNYTKGSTNLFGLNYGYSQNGGNNGEITNITEPAEAGQSVNYSYDALGRLSTAVSVGSANFPKWGLSFTYDRYGNRTAEVPTAGSGMPSNSVAVDATTNRIIGGYAYDAAGNMTNDGSNTLVYDGENRVASTASGSASGNYTYDGGGHRVKKTAGGTTTVYIFSLSKVIAEYDNSAAVSSPTREYIYSGSSLLAKIENGTTIYYQADHLSARLLTDSNGNVVGQRGHYPFGETWYESGTTTKFKFTAYERDGESGNDFAMARYNVNRLGRFSSPDLLAGSPSNPQTLNRFTYAQDDPINFTDPSGMFIAPLLRNLFNNFSGLSTGGFGSGWNEFDLLNSSTVLQGFWINWHVKINPEFLGEAWTVIDGIEPVYGGLLVDPSDPGGGGGGEGGGGRAPARTPKPHVDRKVLADCLQSLFGVSLADFEESRPGGKGSFTGFGPDLRTNHGKTGPIVVVNDASTYNAAQIAAIVGDSRAIGYTDPRAPYENYGNNNNNLTGTLVNQVHELGHSLFSITQTLSPLVPEPQEMGSALEDCVRQHHGFVRY